MTWFVVYFHCQFGCLGKVAEVVEEVENVAEVVEKVATTAENVSAKVADKLPDNGKLKEVALFVEHVSSVIAKDAELTTDLIHKVIFHKFKHFLFYKIRLLFFLFKINS